MSPRKRVVPNLLDRHKADIQYSVGGLTIGVSGVQASDSAHVAAAILNAVRELRKHYPELDPELNPVHAGGHEVPDEEAPDSYVLPPEARKVVGFR